MSASQRLHRCEEEAITLQLATGGVAGRKSGSFELHAPVSEAAADSRS